MLALLALQLASVSARPSAFEVASVPFHRQVTEYACGKQALPAAAAVAVALFVNDSVSDQLCFAGDSSFEMVMNYFGGDLDQRAIIDVMRTSSEEGPLRGPDELQLILDTQQCVNRNPVV